MAEGHGTSLVAPKTSAAFYLQNGYLPYHSSTRQGCVRPTVRFPALRSVHLYGTANMLHRRLNYKSPSDTTTWLLHLNRSLLFTNLAWRKHRLGKNASGPSAVEEGHGYQYGERR